MPKSRSEQIFDHAQKFATPFRTNLGHTWAIVPDGPGRYRGYPVSSRSFQHWLAHSFHSEHSIFPGGNALENAIRMFAAQAQHSAFPAGDIFTRVGCRGDRRLPESVLFQLANANSEVVEITPQGHRLVSSDSWHFLTGPATLPLPRPVDNHGTLRDLLAPVLNRDGVALERAIVWLFAALRPSAPYPVLVITGEPGSGKSMLARMLRHLIDPSAVPLLIPPSTDQHLFTLALHNHILAFDDIATLPHSIAESLARIATGAGLGICGRNIFDAPEPIALARPVIVTSNGKDIPACFGNNAIRIDLPPMKPENVRTETSLAQTHQSALPEILGTLCAAVAAALLNRASTEAPPVSRFADVHQWTMAAAPILGLTAEQINRAVAANPLVDALHSLLQTQPQWTGTATDLLKNLDLLGFKDLATDARHLSVQLNALSLPLFGIELEHSRSRNEYLLHLRKQTAPVSLRERHSQSTNRMQ